MATYTQRWVMIGEGVLGRPATAAELTRLGDAISRSVAMMLPTPWAQMTNAQKAEACVKYTHRHFVGLVKQIDQQAAANTASAQAAAAVDTEFAEAP